ncbi:permease [Microbacterium luticocti]|uniref:permease n=1 Tax=Microbacterium luticocti TaxID=451764 RepID=UPI00040770F9|nr:permease [Microbacterium luticocti]
MTRTDAATGATTATRRSGRLAARRGPLALGVGLAVIAVLFALNALAPALMPGIPTRAQDGLTLAISVLIESLPFVVLGVVLSIVVQVWIPPGAIERWMPRRAWARRAVLSLLGMVIPVCECGNVPFARGLLMRGFTVPETLTFLIAAPIVNPIVIITTHQAFGFGDGILVARLVAGYLIANLIGWIYSRHPDPDGLLTDRFRDTCELVVHEPGSRWRRSLAQFLVELRAVMPALVIGSAVAGAVQVLVPRNALLAIGSNPVLSIVAMVMLAMIVSICSNVDSFFALSFASTFTPGSIVAFLLVGPLVDVKMLVLLRTTFTTRVLAGMVVTVVLAAFAIAVGVNLVA